MGWEARLSGSGRLGERPPKVLRLGSGRAAGRGVRLGAAGSLTTGEAASAGRLGGKAGNARRGSLAAPPIAGLDCQAQVAPSPLKCPCRPSGFRPLAVRAVSQAAASCSLRSAFL